MRIATQDPGRPEWSHPLGRVTAGTRRDERACISPRIWARLTFVLLILIAPALVVRAQDAPGDLDRDFGVGGKVRSRLDGLGGAGVDAVVQTDGKIVVLASTFRVGTAGDFALTRYNSDGTLDKSFGTNGLVFTDIGGYYDDPSTLLLQND